jgi:hypothetical protein
MTGNEIIRWGLELPRRSPLFRHLFRKDPGKFDNSSQAERLAALNYDPALGWHLASSCASEGETLPPYICRSALLRANAFLLDPDHPDYRVAMAQSLALPEAAAARDLLWALLASEDLSLEAVAEIYQCELDLVRLVDQLFWNLRDRRKEPGYVAQILFRHTRFPGKADRKHEQMQAGLRLIRLGYEKGSRAVLQAAGALALIDENVTPEVLAAEITRTILSRSAIAFDMGLETKLQGQALQLVLQATKQQAMQPADEDRRRGLAGMSLSMAISESFERMMRPELERRLAMQRGIEIGEAHAWNDVANMNGSAPQNQIP